MIRKIVKLRARIAKISLRIAGIQNICPHANVVKVPKGDTGNWDKGQDRYWFECRCPDCDKYWEEDQ